MSSDRSLRLELAGSVIALVLGLIMLWPCGAVAEVHSVPQQFTTISAAIAEANPGDVIEVSDGVYEENLIIVKALTLRSASSSEAVVLRHGGRTASTLSIELSDDSRVTVEGIGFEIEEPGACIRIDCEPESQVYVRSCEFVFKSEVVNRDDEVAGVLVVGGNATIMNSTFFGPNADLSRLDRSNGILTRGTSIVTVRRCEFQNLEDAVQTNSGAYLAVYDCTVRNSIAGLNIWNGDVSDTKVKLINNTIRECIAGITLVGRTSTCEITDNRIFDTRWTPFRIHLAQTCNTADGAAFVGVLEGSDNRLSDYDALCPAREDPFWPAGFFR
jgi:nitrous oxidase accessory protein NosD